MEDRVPDVERAIQADHQEVAHAEHRTEGSVPAAGAGQPVGFANEEATTGNCLCEFLCVQKRGDSGLGFLSLPTVRLRFLLKFIFPRAKPNPPFPIRWAAIVTVADALDLLPNV